MSDLVYEKRERYAVFRMNRPERLNALGGTMQQELTAALADFTADPAMRAGIVTGEGRAFSAGADLKEMAARNARGSQRTTRTIGGTTLQFSRNPKPFIAAINGLCLAGGLERALDCDIRICSSEAYFGLFEVKRGILAGYAVHHLARVIPFGEAMYILLTGDRVSPEQALRCGLVHEVLEPKQLMPRAVEIAEMIADNAPLSVEGTKAVTHQWRHLQIDESYRYAERVSSTRAVPTTARWSCCRASRSRRSPPTSRSSSRACSSTLNNALTGAIGASTLPGYAQAGAPANGIAHVLVGVAYAVVALLLAFQMLMRLALVDVLIALAPLSSRCSGRSRRRRAGRAGGRTSSRSPSSSRPCRCSRCASARCSW